MPTMWSDFSIVAKPFIQKSVQIKKDQLPKKFIYNIKVATVHRTIHDDKKWGKEKMNEKEKCNRFKLIANGN